MKKILLALMLCAISTNAFLVNRELSKEESDELNKDPRPWNSILMERAEGENTKERIENYKKLLKKNDDDFEVYDNFELAYLKLIIRHLETTKIDGCKDINEIYEELDFPLIDLSKIEKLTVNDFLDHFERELEFKERKNVKSIVGLRSPERKLPEELENLQFKQHKVYEFIGHRSWKRCMVSFDDLKKEAMDSIKD